MWLSLVERFVRDEEVVSSNLVTPTIKIRIADFYFEDIEYHQEHEYQSVFLRMLYNESKQ